MKIICIDHCFTKDPISLELRPDSALLRENDTFYMKNGSTYSFQAGIALRISRVTKCISAKFAKRCFDQIRLAVAFKDDTLWEELSKKGISTMPATCFDYSLALSEGSLSGNSCEEMELNLEHESQKETFRFSSSGYTIEELISAVSESLTLKVGDYVVILFPKRYVAKVGRIMCSLMGDTLLDFEIK